jgi:hypothetical protein
MNISFEEGEWRVPSRRPICPLFSMINAPAAIRAVMEMRAAVDPNIEKSSIANMIMAVTRCSAAPGWQSAPI